MELVSEQGLGLLFSVLEHLRRGRRREALRGGHQGTLAFRVFWYHPLWGLPMRAFSDERQGGIRQGALEQEPGGPASGPVLG